MADIVFPNSAGGPIGLDYLPANYDLVLYRGDYLPFSVTLKDSDENPLNLTGHVAQCSIRATAASETAFDAECVVTALEGKIDITFSSAVTSTLDAGEYVWDFQVVDPDDNVRTYFAGDVTVYGEVSR